MSNSQRIDRLLRNSRLQKYEIDKLCPPVLFLVFLLLRLMPIIPKLCIYFIYVQHLKKEPDRIRSGSSMHLTLQLLLPFGLQANQPADRVLLRLHQRLKPGLS